MIFKILIIISILLNIFFVYYINKKNIKKLIFKSKIKKIDVTDIHEIFKLKNISNNLSGPKKEAIIKSFSISTDNNIVGMTSDYEAWIISSLSKISKNIFEFGTCSGKTTYLMALNSNENSKITTITLNPDEVLSFAKKTDDNDVSFRNIKNESIYNKFLFSNTDVEKKNRYNFSEFFRI